MYQPSIKDAKSTFKTREEIAAAYNISTKTLRRKFKKEGLSFSQGLLSIKEQAIIYQVFGKPNR